MPGTRVPRRLIRLPARPLAIDAVRQARQRCWRYGGSSTSTSRRSLTASIMRCSCVRSGECRRLSVGAAVCGALAEGANAEGRRRNRASRCRDASGRRDQSDSRQPVPALRVRTRGWPGPGLPFRSNGMPTMPSVIAEHVTAKPCRSRCKSVCGLPTGASSAEKKIVYCRTPNRKGTYPCRDIRLSRLLVPAGDWRHGAAANSVSRSCGGSGHGAQEDAREVRRWNLQTRTTRPSMIWPGWSIRTSGRIKLLQPLLQVGAV